VITIREYKTHQRTRRPIDFAKVGKGWRGLEDSVLELDKFKRSQYRTTFGNKESIMRALENQDKVFLRNLSVYYMGVSGIYQRLVEYLSNILTYDWFAYPRIINKEVDKESIEEGMKKILTFLDNMHLPVTLADITRTIVIEGSYYGYLIHNASKTNAALLELPANYCRSRMFVNGMPVVEFNLKYFEDEFKDDELRAAVLNTFPKEFNDNYKRFKAGLIQTDPIDRGAWFICDTNFAMKFSLTDNDVPFFAAVIPTILDLDEAKQLDLKKTTQELLKIIIQKMPLDKNGDLIFDIEESQEMHNAASRMLSHATNVDILTTFADIEVADLDNSSASTIKDPLAKVERGIFNEAGVSQNLFATDGNLSLEKSILNDEAVMFKLLDEYQNRLNAILQVLFSSRDIEFKLSLPHLSIYNNERKQKMYKDMATNGYSKILPAIASGITQTEFLSLNYYEENILNIGEKLIPVQSSNTQSSKDQSGEVGAPKKEESELAEKTIQNLESQS
jgi:hypothetical protein